MGAIKRKTTIDRIKQRALRKSGQAVLRARHALFFGPDMTRWLNGLLKESELTPEQRSALAYSGAWITAPFTVAQDILNGVVPKQSVRQKNDLYFLRKQSAILILPSFTGTGMATLTILNAFAGS